MTSHPSALAYSAAITTSQKVFLGDTEFASDVDKTLTLSIVHNKRKVPSIRDVESYKNI